MRTYSPKPGDNTPVWPVIDATDVVLGRLATHAATLLRGKHKPSFAPHMDMGDFVIIINAEKVALTGAKKQQKMDYRHSASPQPRMRNCWSPTPVAPLRRPSRECFRTTSWAASNSRS